MSPSNQYPTSCILQKKKKNVKGRKIEKMKVKNQGRWIERENREERSKERLDSELKVLPLGKLTL